MRARAFRRAACRRKRSYGSLAEAWLISKRAYADTGRRHKAYGCTACGNYHVHQAEDQAVTR